jgi:hypothetical protein
LLDAARAAGAQQGIIENMRFNAGPRRATLVRLAELFEASPQATAARPAALDDARGDGEEPLDPFVEADTLLAVSWRYGSYLNVLSFGEISYAYRPA